MRIFKKLSILVALQLGFYVSAQFNLGIESNTQWYIDDDKIQLSEEDAEERLRTNTYIRGDYTYKNLKATVQLEAYEPIALLNYNPDYEDTNIGTVSLNYRNDKLGLDVTAGHFYEQFGSGLVFRAWEDRQIGINNSIFGGKINYKPIDEVEVKVIAGKQRIGMGFDFSDGFQYGADVNFDLSNTFKLENSSLSLGASFLNRNETLEDPMVTESVPDNVSTYGIRADYQGKKFYIGSEYVRKSDDALVTFGNVQPDTQDPGSALLINTGYSVKGFGLDVNLRRTENMNFFSERTLEGNTFFRGVLNYLPSLVKQYDYALENIFVYQAQTDLTFLPLLKAGEIGGQIDLFYKFKKGTAIGGKYGTFLSLNSSRWYGLDVEGDRNTREHSTSYFGTGERFYADFGAEVRKKWTKKFSSIFGFLNQYYNAQFVEDTTGEYTQTVAVIDNTIKLNKKRSIRFDLQHQWSNSRFENWMGGTLELGLSPQISVWVNDIYNYGNPDEEDQIHFYNVGTSYSKGATRIALNYGRQRGGLLCIGGVCRFVPESAGFTLNITTNF